MSIYKAFYKRLNKKTLLIAVIPLIIIIAVEIVTTSMIPYTRKLIIDSLVAFDHHWFILAAVIGFVNSLILSGAQGLKLWTGQIVSFSAREALMKTIKKDWINKNGYASVTNPCGRLNDDTRVATEQALQVAVEIIISVCIVLGLLTSIWQWPTLFWTAILYSTLSMVLAALYRAPLIRTKYALSNSEGQHRIALTKISMQQGDYSSKARWAELTQVYHKYIAVCRNYKLFNAFQSAAMYTIPFFIMAPAFFAHKITLGDVTQGTLTFDLLVLNATIWVQLYPQVTEAQTAFIRVNEFYKEVNE